MGKLVFLLCIFIVISSVAARSGRHHEKELTVEIFDTKIPLPQWMASINNYLNGKDGVIPKLKSFFSGDGPLFTNLFGDKVSFRTKMPRNKKDAVRSFNKFFQNLQKDSTTRVVFVVYVNIVVTFIVYVVLFIKQIQHARRQSRQKRQIKKHRKLDEIDRKDYLARRQAIMNQHANEHPDILRPGLLSEMDDEELFEEVPRKSSDTSDITVNRTNAVLAGSRRILGPELFSPHEPANSPNTEEIQLNAANLERDMSDISSSSFPNLSNQQESPL